MVFDRMLNERCTPVQPHFYRLPGVWRRCTQVMLLGLLGTTVWLGQALADCLPQRAGVLMSTPLSSRLYRVGESVQGVLEHPMALSPTVTLPSGTMLQGRVTGVKVGERTGPPGKIRIQFTKASTLDLGVIPLLALPDTEGGWLLPQDADTAVWQVSLSRSTRLLNSMVQRRLGTDRAVWASMLGIQENVIPDITTDSFIEQYHRNNVLVGAGDRIYLRFACLGENASPLQSLPRLDK